MQLDVLEKLEEKIHASLSTIRQLRSENAAASEGSGLSDETQNVVREKLQEMLQWLDDLDDLMKSEG